MLKKRKAERMSDFSFKLMQCTFKIIDFFYPYIKKRIKKFNIQQDMIVVDYGCGPGRYTIEFAKIVGEKGRIYAVDIHDLAIEVVKKKILKNNFKNIVPVVTNGYNSNLDNNIADIICALDMFFIIKKSAEFLKELHRIIKKDGILIIDDGHQPRTETKKSIAESGLWNIYEETNDYLKCSPK